MDPPSTSVFFEGSVLKENSALVRRNLRMVAGGVEVVMSTEAVDDAEALYDLGSS